MHFPANPGGILRSLFSSRSGRMFPPLEQTLHPSVYLETSHSKPSYLEINSLYPFIAPLPFSNLSYQHLSNFLYWAGVMVWNPLWKGHFMFFFFFLQENLTAPVKQKKFQHLSSSLSCTTFYNPLSTPPRFCSNWALITSKQLQSPNEGLLHWGRRRKKVQKLLQKLRVKDLNRSVGVSLVALHRKSIKEERSLLYIFPL